MKTTAIYHSADYDGIFCREIARKFMPEAKLIGWNFGDAKLKMPEGEVYILDLSPDCIDGIAGLGQTACIDEHDYLRRIIWKVLNPAADVTPASLAKAASCYMKCASGKLLLAEQVYLLCQLVEQTQPG